MKVLIPKLVRLDIETRKESVEYTIFSSRF